jgi:hypothetical protein
VIFSFDRRSFGFVNVAELLKKQTFVSESAIPKNRNLKFRSSGFGKLIGKLFRHPFAGLRDRGCNKHFGLSEKHIILVWSSPLQ